MPIKRTLHPELWIVIASHLPRRSLVSLCHTSSGIRQLTRPLLYREVILVWDSHHDTIKLLSSNNNLTNIVQAFTLKITSYRLERKGIIWPDELGLQGLLFDVLTAMNSLRKLSLPLSICIKLIHNPAKCQKFLSHFNNRETPLHTVLLAGRTPHPYYLFPVSPADVPYPD
jgi:hypothetical protein